MLELNLRWNGVYVRIRFLFEWSLCWNSGLGALDCWEGIGPLLLLAVHCPQAGLPASTLLEQQLELQHELPSSINSNSSMNSITA